MLTRSIASVLVLATALAGCGTRKPVAPPSPAQLAAMEADLAQQKARLAALAVEDVQQSAIVTRVRFDRGSYRPGFERLRVVRRQNTFNNVAAQVVLNVALIALTRSAAVQGFSKDDLAGDELAELSNEPFAANPAMQELADGLGRVATQHYVRRAMEAVAQAGTDGSTLEDTLGAVQLPQDFGTPLTPGHWHLVYENLTGDDETYRLKFGATLGYNHRGAQGCTHASEPLPWSQWRADGWQRLREERTKALSHCLDVLGTYLRTHW